jgi:hypothetical protein
MLRESVEDRLRLAIYSMTGENFGFIFISDIQRQYRELRAYPFGAPFISPRDLCLILWLPFDSRAAEMLGEEMARFNQSLFIEASTPLAIVNQADVVRHHCLTIDVSMADWLDVEWAYGQIHGIRWANDWLHEHGVLARKSGTRGRPPSDTKHEPRLHIAPDDPTVLIADHPYDPTPPSITILPWRASLSGFPTYNDEIDDKTIIAINGCALSQIKSLWPKIRAYRTHKHNGYDPSHPQHRPKTPFTLYGTAQFINDYDAADNKAAFLLKEAERLHAQGHDVELDSLIRRVRRFNAR